MSILEVIVSLITALGGVSVFEFIKWLYNRKNTARISDAQADTEEFRALREYNEFLQQQLQAKEERFCEQTARLRETQDRLFAARQETAETKLELYMKRCERKRCGEREPQNGY